MSEFRNKLIVIAGGGKFGARAAITSKKLLARTILVDKIPDCKASRLADEKVEGVGLERVLTVKPGNVTFFVCDAVEFLTNCLEAITPDYIVPAVPGNLTGLVVKRWLEKGGFDVKSDPKAMNRVLENVPKRLLLHLDKNSAVIITSYMPKGKLCKVPCDQPVDLCPTTGRAKIGSMHHILTRAVRNRVTCSKIVYSHKLGPEVGCFGGTEFASFLSHIEQLEIPYSLAIGTSCDCHGILNLFSVNERRSGIATSAH